MSSVKKDYIRPLDLRHGLAVERHVFTGRDAGNDLGLVVLADGTLTEVRGTEQSIRFQVARPLNAVDLSIHLDRTVREVTSSTPENTEYVVGGASDGALIARLTAWLSEQHIESLDLRAGPARLEEVFLRLTAAKP